MRSSLNRQRIGVLLIALVIFSGVALGASPLFTASSGVSYETPSGLTVNTTTDHHLGASNPFIDNETVDLNNVTFSAPGAASITADQFLGTTTTVSSIDASSNDITINPGDKSSVTVSGGVTSLSFEDVSLDRTDQLTYSASSSGSITVRGLSSNTTYAAATAGGTLLSSGTTTSNGEATISVEAATNQDVVLYEPTSPEIDNLNAEPEDGADLSQRDINLSVPVSDTDFGNFDELNVTFYIDGEVVHSENITSNGTVSTTETVSTGGQHTWHVEVTDTYGLTTESDSDTSTSDSEPFTFSNTATLKIYNESSTTELVNQTSIEVTFFGDSQTTVTRSADDGVIDFSGLPLNETFIVDIEADGYESRTILIPSLLKQERAYLLPTSADSVQVRFRLDDATGTFTTRSFVYVEKPITVNNETQYQILTSDRFGANGFTTTLEKDVRYELRIKNEQGTVAQLSTYRPTVSETVNLQPSAASVTAPENQAVGYEINYDKDAETVTVEYVDPADQTEELTVEIVSKDGENTLKSAQTYDNPSSLSLSVPTNGTLNKSYWVNLTGTRSGEDITVTETIGPEKAILTPSVLPGGWQQLLGGMAILLIAGVFSSLNAGVGVLITSLFGGLLWFFGLMSGLASGSAVALSIGVATLNLLRSQ